MTRDNLIQRLIDTGASNETLCHVMHILDEPVRIQPPELDELFAKCCLAVGADVSAARSKNKKNVNVRARYVFIHYLQKHFTGVFTLETIGEYLGGRDHTTIIHGRDEFKKLLENSDEIAERDLSNLKLILVGGKPILLSPVKLSRQKSFKFIKVFYEYRTDRWYRDIKAIRYFYGMHKSAKINSYRFKARHISTDKIKEIDLFEI